MSFRRWSLLDCTKIVMSKFWIDPHGTLIPVGDDLSHEEWANAHGYEQEKLLAQSYCSVERQGWHRVSSGALP
jgi:hypothetical protein